MHQQVVHVDSGDVRCPDIPWGLNEGENCNARVKPVIVPGEHDVLACQAAIWKQEDPGSGVLCVGGQGLVVQGMVVRGQEEHLPHVETVTIREVEVEVCERVTSVSLCHGGLDEVSY